MIINILQSATNMKQQIYLIRHAQSRSNVDKNILLEKTNVGIELTQTGLSQAKETGEFMVDIFKNNPLAEFKIWNSPYHRTRQTSQIIKSKLTEQNLSFKEEESIYLSERQFGLLDDNQNYFNTHPSEFAHYQLHEKEKKSYFVRPPLGESAFDMCMRLDFFLKSILEKEPQYHHIIISHGACLRGIIMMNEKIAYEDYLLMSNPLNASVIHLDGENGNRGQIFQPTCLSSEG